MVFVLGNMLVLVKHLIKSIIKLSRYSIDLEFLADNLILKLINSEMKLGNVHLCILGTRFTNLESDVDLLDLLLVLLLSSSGLLLRDFKLLLVLSNSMQFILNNSNTSISSLKFIFHHCQRSSQVVILHFIVSTNPFSLSSIIIQLLDFDLAVHGLRLPVPAALDNVVSILGHQSQLHNSISKLLHTDSGLLFKKKHSSRLSIHIFFL